MSDSVLHAMEIGKRQDMQAELARVTAERDQLLDAAVAWWKVRRPKGWTDEQHMDIPRIERSGDAERWLATVVASILEDHKQEAGE